MAESLNSRNVDAYEDTDGAIIQIGGIGDAKKVVMGSSSASGSIYGLEDSDFTLVESADINGTTYVSGSEGNTKTILTYQAGDTSGDYAILTTFQYGLTGNTKIPSKIAETASTIP